jgi:hypothetical protein
MTDKHTPGPWSINSWPQATSDIAIGAPGTPCIARMPLRDVSINEQRANAVLIVTAPDMLAMLRSLLTHNNKVHSNDAYYCFDEAPVRALIAKATGQTP